MDRLYSPVKFLDEFSNEAYQREFLQISCFTCFSGGGRCKCWLRIWGFRLHFWPWYHTNSWKHDFLFFSSCICLASKSELEEMGIIYNNDTIFKKNHFWKVINFIYEYQFPLSVSLIEVVYRMTAVIFRFDKSFFIFLFLWLTLRLRIEGHE